MSERPSAERVVELAVQAARSHPYGWFLTAAGLAPAARLVQHLTVSDDAVVQVGTSPRSRKVRQASEAGWATYAVEDRASFSYASLTGPCVVVTDAAEREQAWAAGLEAFFPAGPLGDDFVLLRLHSRRIELMDFAAGVHPDPYGLVPEVVERSGGGWVRTAAVRAAS